MLLGVPSPEPVLDEDEGAHPMILRALSLLMKKRPEVTSVEELLETLGVGVEEEDRSTA